jgi:hypothetical protein
MDMRIYVRESTSLNKNRRSLCNEGAVRRTIAFGRRPKNMKKLCTNGSVRYGRPHSTAGFFRLDMAASHCLWSLKSSWSTLGERLHTCRSDDVTLTSRLLIDADVDGQHCRLTQRHYSDNDWLRPVIVLNCRSFSIQVRVVLLT